VVKTPARFGVFAQENDIITSVSNAKGQRRQLWKVEKVIKRRDDNVLVKWLGFGEQWNSWVCLADNPGLSSFISANSGNPSISGVTNVILPSLHAEEGEFRLVKHVVKFPQEKKTRLMIDADPSTGLW